jgi:heptaprenyl diphosphate synthase
MKNLLRETLGNPGKMIRSALMLLTAGEYDQAQRPELISSAAALEMVHTSSLILDDMIDDSPLRRGRPTVQQVYGKPIALCSGDYLLVAAVSRLYDKGYLRSARELMEVIQIACDGEMIQHEHKGDVHVTRDAYYQCISRKTAALFRMACSMACSITDKEEVYRCNMEELGECIGLMFQIRDDLLDWTRQEEEIGKPINEDFTEGVYTLPAIYTFAQKEYGDRLRVFAEREALSQEEQAQVRSLVTQAGGVAYAREELCSLGQKAEALLHTLEDGTYTQALSDLVRLLEEE